MMMNRRQWLARAGAASLVSAVRLNASSRDAALGDAAPQLPDKTHFRTTVENEVCLNNARWHPLSNSAMRAVQEYLDYKASGSGRPGDLLEKKNSNKVLFAQLINAKPSEISYVQSTMAGENCVVLGLGLPAPNANIVTDALHFEGSLYLYGEMKKRGVDVRIVRPRNWRIELADLERVVDRKTKLIALSLVSMATGFQHDLKKICDLAHAHDAYVYADIIQAAGAIPIDVTATKVDFCACGTYKWLMGDMGLGFLYVREDLLDRIVTRTQYGYRQLASMEYHLFPYDPPGANILDWTQLKDAGGHFELGTISNTTVFAINSSLRYILQLGVSNIQGYTQSLLARVRKAVPALGLELLTPAESKGPILTLAVPNPSQLEKRLERAKVDVAVYGHRLRISPSVYNDDHDIDQLLDVLSSRG
jgi:selenocysteine lyase/cysteine desulfurase